MKPLHPRPRIRHASATVLQSAKMLGNNPLGGVAALVKLVVRYRWAMIFGWVAIAAGLTVSFPSLETVVGHQSVEMLAPSMPAYKAARQMAEAFDERGSRTMVFVAIENRHGLNADDRLKYGGLVARLRADSAHVLSVRDLIGDTAGSAEAASKDKQAWYLPVGLAGSLGDPKATEAVNAVRDIANQTFAGSTTSVRVTGPPATLVDQMTSMLHDMVPITAGTGMLITVILLIVYRSAFTALLPLMTIAVSLVVVRGVLSGLGESGLPISGMAEAFVVVVLMGAGTDYSIFLISRYHELVRGGAPPIRP